MIDMVNKQDLSDQDDLMRSVKLFETKSGKTRDIYFPKIHTLLFAGCERKVQGEEENKQEELQ